MLKQLILIILILFTIIGCNTNKKVEIKDKNNSIQLGGVFHVVKEGESLWAISKAYKVNIQDIIEINDFNPKSILYPGDEIFIPNVKNLINKPITSKNEHKEESNDKFEYKKAKSKSKNVNKTKDLPSKYLKSMIWPTNGIVITEFGINQKFKSDGLDIAAPLGTKILSVMDGSIIYSGNQSGYGNIIIIKHKDKIITIYAHNQKNLVKAGEKVKKGELIGTIGNTGNAQRYQLHFELRKGVKAINPNPYLELK